jgi:hypothetical protein
MAEQMAEQVVHATARSFAISLPSRASPFGVTSVWSNRRVSASSPRVNGSVELLEVWE